MRVFLAALSLAFAPGAIAQTAVGGGTPASARQVAAFGAASFSPTDDPLAFHLNPALSAGTRHGFTLSGATAPLGVYTREGLSGIALVYGGDLNVGSVPLRVGAGLSVERFSSSLAVSYDAEDLLGTFDSREEAGMLSVSAETTGPVRLAVGGSARLLRESRDLAARNLSRGVTPSADLGVLATADLAALSGLAPEATSGVVPALTVSAGYVARNLGPSREVGDVFASGGTVQTRPLHREAALGWGAAVGVDFATPAGRIPLVRIRADLEAESDLVTFDFAALEYGYASPLGGLSVGQALTGSGRVGEVRCGETCTSFRYTEGRRSLTLDALGAAHLTLGWLNYGTGSSVSNRSWGLGLDPLAAVRVVRTLQGRSPSSLDRYSVRLDYGRYLNDSQQTFPEPQAYDAFSLSLSVRP